MCFRLVYVIGSCARVEKTQTTSILSYTSLNRVICMCFIFYFYLYTTITYLHIIYYYICGTGITNKNCQNIRFAAVERLRVVINTSICFWKKKSYNKYLTYITIIIRFLCFFLTSFYPFKETSRRVIIHEIMWP